MNKKQKKNMFHAIFKKEGDKLTISNGGDKYLYKEFVSHLEEGQYVDLFFDANVSNGSLAQLARVHASIKLMSSELGYSFEDMKLEVKNSAGLCIEKEIAGERFKICKSFALCSIEELSLAITAINEIAEFNNIILP